ncbi:MAG: recombinase family protein [Chloroflexota bacterium]|nr:recombinase family protein [Chloroflexota bacterium]
MSSTEQERDGFSIPAQLRALHEYAKKQHFKIVREFIEAETAKRAGRPEFKEMLAFLEASDSVKTVLVEKTDRLYRNFRDYVTVDELDLEIHLVKENEILGQDSKSHQKFIHGIKVLMAKNFIDNLSEETKKGMAEKVRAGGFPHRAPAGYLNDRLTRTIVVDPVRGPYIRRLFELYAAGRDSLAALQDRADQDGMLPSGSASRVEYILKNPFYVGQVRWAGELHSGSQEPLVSRELFDQVQRRVRDGGRRLGKSKKKEFAFAGLLRCADCGHALTPMLIKRRYIYYRCANYRGCPTPYYREEDLAAGFNGILGRLVIPDAVADWVVAHMTRELQTAADEAAAKVERLDHDLAAVARRLSQAYADHLDGKIDEAVWATLSAGWSAERARLEHQIERARPSPRQSAEATEPDIRHRPHIPDVRLAALGRPGLRLASVLIEQIVVGAGAMQPRLRPPFAALMSTAGPSQAA